MDKIGRIVWVILTCITAATFAADSGLYIKSASMPFYPPDRSRGSHSRKGIATIRHQRARRNLRG
jgi:hypothetical protein